MKLFSFDQLILWIVEFLALCLAVLVAVKLVQGSVTGVLYLQVGGIDVTTSPTVFAYYFALLLAGEVLFFIGAWPLIRRSAIWLKVVLLRMVNRY